LKSIQIGKTLAEKVHVLNLKGVSGANLAQKTFDEIAASKGLKKRAKNIKPISSKVKIIQKFQNFSV
jgi:hypothetical protein